MSDQYLGEIRMFSGNYAPQDWVMCNGQLLPINQYEALYSLIGTTYGGDGVTTFAVPDLRGRVPIHTGMNATTGTNYSLAQKGGTEKVTLTDSQLTAHTHGVQSSSVGGTSTSPGNSVWAQSSKQQYSTAAPNAIMDNATVSSVGGNQAHDNMMPFLIVTYIIAVQGEYPSFN